MSVTTTSAPPVPSPLDAVCTAEHLQEVVGAYVGVPAFVFDVETVGTHRVDPRRNEVTWITLATKGRVDVIPMGHPNGDFIRTDFPLLPSAEKRVAARRASGVAEAQVLREADFSRDERKAVRVFESPPDQVTRAEVFAALKPLFFSDQVKVGHNVGFDLQSVAKYYGWNMPAPPYFCTMISQFILDSRNKIRMGLDDCLKREFDHVMVKGVGKEIERHSFADAFTYCVQDGVWTWALYERCMKRLIAEKGRRPMRLDMDVLAVTCDMEMAGADIDVPALRDLKDSLEDDLEAAKGRVYAAAGKAFVLGSNVTKAALLWGPKKEGGQGLRPRILTEGGKTRRRQGVPLTITDYSVSAEALEPFRDINPLATTMLEFADLTKLMSTYVIPYLGGEVTRTVDGKVKTKIRESHMLNGRVHTQFVLTGAETGRFSSRNPNLQNVPNASTVNGKRIRNLFCAPAGHSLVVADYSQIEPRVIASLTGDQRLVEAFKTGQDIYTTIADPFHVDRTAGKVLMLSLSYGVGPDKIAASIGVPLKRAEELLKDFETEFASIYRYKRHVVRLARAQRPAPFVTTLIGRRRYLPDLKSTEFGLKARAERQAFNTIIQGSAADLIKIAMVRANRMIPEQARLSLTIHDELVTVTPTAIADQTAAAIRSAMEEIHALDVPLVADVKIVERWGEAK